MAPSTWTSQTRSPAPCASRTRANSAPRRRPEHGSPDVEHRHLHAGHLPWRGTDQQGSDHPSHPAHVGRERDQRHHHRGRAGRRRWRTRLDLVGIRIRGGGAGHDERRGRVCRDGPDAPDVHQEAGGEVMPFGLTEFLYLIAAVLFIIGLKRLSSPLTARRGNLVSGVGMLIAIAVTLFDRHILSFEVIAAGLLVGSALGWWMARTVKMTAMPQMVALLNGFGGGASLFVGAAEFLKVELVGGTAPLDVAITTQLSLLIGAVTLTGSVIAWAKLQEVMTGRPITFPMQKAVNAVWFLAIAALATYQILTPDQLLWPFYLVIGLSLVLGVLLVIPIGGADMPVVISLLNSYSGIAAAVTGFVLENNLLIITGALVGASGIILTQIMCQAMNRSLVSVLLGGFGMTA